MRGNLPWQGIPARSKKEKYEKIRDSKIASTVDILSKGMPKEFATYMNYVKALKFDQKPDIPYLRRLFRDLAKR